MVPGLADDMMAAAPWWFALETWVFLVVGLLLVEGSSTRALS